MSTYKRRARRARRRGFSLFEIMVAIPIVMLIFAGTITLYVTSMRTFAQTAAAVYASMDASNAIQHTIDLTREAQTYALPTENTFVLPAGYTTSNLWTTYNNETINTGVELVMPPNATTSEMGYQVGNPSQISVVNSSGNTIALAQVPYYSNGPSTQSYLIYRGDPNGTADPNPSQQTTSTTFDNWLAAQTVRPSQGTYLWELNIQTGTLTPLCKSVALSPDSVQFVRPTSTPNSNGGTPEPYEVEIKVVSSYYSPLYGSLSDEEVNSGEVSSLDGKCVYMRDHQTAATTPTNASTTSTNNAFQFSK